MFLSTRDYDNWWYRFIVGASKKNCEKILKKKLKLKIFKNYNFPNLSYIFFFINLAITGKIFSKKERALIHYKDIELGRFVISNTFINFRTYVDKKLFYYYLFKNFLKAGSIIRACENYYKNNNIEGLYVDHCGYINGVIFSFFSKKNIPIYNNNYPNGIFGIDYRKKSKLKIDKYEKALKIKKKIKLDKNKENIAKKCLRNLTQKKNFIPWLSECKFRKINKVNYKDFDYVIYTHSFTDGQLWYGYDGFENTLDWLIFTIDRLKNKNKKILVKAHPNFFNKSFAAFAEWDRKIFNVVREKYKNFKNIFFLNTPIHNYELLKRLNDKCVLVTKYGSTLLEGSFMNYKTICSESNFFDTTFKISNTWNNINDYEKLLSKDYENLNSCNQKDLYLLIYQLFYIYDSPYNSKYFYKNIVKRSKLSSSKKEFLNLEFKKKHNIIIKKISDRIDLL